MKHSLIKAGCLQIAGGQKYLPPRRDENAPDLYIPFLGLCTYTILASIALTLRGKFAPDKMYGLVSSLGPFRANSSMASQHPGRTFCFVVAIPKNIDAFPFANYFLGPKPREEISLDFSRLPVSSWASTTSFPVLTRLGVLAHFLFGFWVEDVL